MDAPWTWSTVAFIFLINLGGYIIIIHLHRVFVESLEIFLECPLLLLNKPYLLVL